MFRYVITPVVVRENCSQSPARVSSLASDGCISLICKILLRPAKRVRRFDWNSTTCAGLLQCMQCCQAERKPGDPLCKSGQYIAQIMRAQIDAAQRYQHNERESAQYDQDSPEPLACVCHRICCQYAIKLSWVAGALALALAANGARMPSTADDVLAEIRSAALRVASVPLRRYGLDSLSVMRQWYYAHAQQLQGQVLHCNTQQLQGQVLHCNTPLRASAANASLAKLQLSKL